MKSIDPVSRYMSAMSKRQTLLTRYINKVGNRRHWLWQKPFTKEKTAAKQGFSETGASCADRKPRKLCVCRNQAALPPDRSRNPEAKASPQSYRLARNVPMILSSGITCMKVPTTSFASGP